MQTTDDDATPTRDKETPTEDETGQSNGFDDSASEVGTAPAEDGEVAPVDEGEVAPARPVTTTVSHPGLGEATGILDNREKTRRDLLIAALTAAIGLLGLVMGIGDASNGDEVGLLFAGIGLILLAYGLNELRAGAARMMRPVRLVVADRGFDFPSGLGPITWDEIAAVGFEDFPENGQPTVLRARVRAPDEFAERHALTNRARNRLLSRDGWIAIGGGMAMPLEEVLGMMKERLGQSRGRTRPDGAASGRHRHTSRTSRH